MSEVLINGFKTNVKPGDVIQVMMMPAEMAPHQDPEKRDVVVLEVYPKFSLCAVNYGTDRQYPITLSTQELYRCGYAQAKLGSRGFYGVEMVHHMMGGENKSELDQEFDDALVG